MATRMRRVLTRTDVPRRRLRRRSIAHACHGIWRIVRPMAVVRHRRHGERQSLVDLVEVRLPLHVRYLLAFVRLHPLHQYRQVREAPDEALVVVRAVVVSGLVQPFEAPAVQLASERFILAQREVRRHDFLHEEVLVVDLPRPAVWHPGDYMRILGIRENQVQLVRKVRQRLLSRRQLAWRKIGIVAIGVIDTARWRLIIR